MKIVQLETQAYRGVPDGTYTFSQDAQPAKLTIVRGGARAGKTSLLNAIADAKEAVARSAPRRGGARRLGAAGGHVIAAWHLDESEADAARLSDVVATSRWTFVDGRESVDAPAGLKKLLGSFALSDDVAKLQWFGEELVTLAWRDVPAVATLRSECSTSRADKLAWAPAALRDALLAEALAVRSKLREQGMIVEAEAVEATAAASKRFREAVRAVAPHLRIGPVVDRGFGPEPTFATAASETGVPWADLCATDRRALALAFAAVHLGLSRSCILWDAPDRMFGASGFATILAGMRELLPDAQLIITVDGGTTVPAGAHLIELEADG